MRLGRSRREFLRDAAKMAVGSSLLSASPFLRGEAGKKRKVIVITFGGGARDQETFAAEGQENIPHLIQELIPQSSFFYSGDKPGHPRPLRRHGKPGEPASTRH